MNLKDVKPGDFFSETTYFKVLQINERSTVFNNFTDGKEIVISNDYLTNLMKTDSQYVKEEKVNKTQIREIFEGIGGNVCTVAFFKQSKKKTNKQLDLEKKGIQDSFEQVIGKSRLTKAEIIEIAKKEVRRVCENPISKEIPGKLRIIRGYKTQFNSVDGRYNFMDLQITQTRPVTITQIVSIIHDDVKYFINGHKNTL